MNERKEPDPGRFQDVGGNDRIPTLTEIASPENKSPEQGESGKPQGALSGDDPGYGQRFRDSDPFSADTRADAVADRIPSSNATTIDESEIEDAADRVLDQLAPLLREAVTAALQDLLARRPPQD